MDRIRIRGGRPLAGRIRIGGAKNAALPLMCASLLTDQPLVLTNLPHLADIATLAHLLGVMGVEFAMMGGDDGRDAEFGKIVELKARFDAEPFAPYDLVRKMRASVLVLGALLASRGRAKVSLPGGCAIGTRPVDLHLKGLQAMGAELELESGYVLARAPGGLKGAEFIFPFVSVGATENLLMAASLAKGETVLDNAAREPEVVDLARCLVAMGARIEGIGTRRLVIQGVDRLHGARYQVLPDRIEAGSYAVAAAITGGRLELEDAPVEQMGATLDALRQAGVAIERGERSLIVDAGGRRPKAVDLVTQPHPAFPTDMQAQMMALMTVADGAASITETVFENRYMHVPELCRMGADIQVHGSTALVRGPRPLRGAPVMATDLRASMSLIIAGLAAEGETIVSRVYHLDRGYERLEEKMALAGADIERLKG